MANQCIPIAARWLHEHSTLGHPQRKAMAGLCPALLDALPAPAAGARPRLVGIGGPPGCGKSTLAAMLEHVAGRSGRSCLRLSLDDYYLPRGVRQRVAAETHPLCAVRGVPGTHDLGLLSEHLDTLLQGRDATLELPRFDKARDDRRDRTVTLKLTAPLDYVFLEGWICGAPVQPAATLAEPVNRLETEADPNGTWRAWVNDRLGDFGRAVNARMNQCWYLRAPDWDAVIDWRWRQERELPVPALADRAAVRAFLAHYERLVKHTQETAREWADLVIDMDAAHCATIARNRQRPE